MKGKRINNKLSSLKEILTNRRIDFAIISEATIKEGTPVIKARGSIPSEQITRKELEAQ